MRQTESCIEYFVFFFLAPLILLIGVFGNTIGFVVFVKRDLIKIGPVFMYKFLFVFDSAALISVSNYYLTEIFHINFVAFTSLSCRLYGYILFSVSSVSPMLLVYIYLERLLSLKYPVESNFLRKQKSQKIYLAVILLINLIIYIQVPFTYDLIASKNISTCEFIDSKSREISSFINFFNKILIPFSLMIIITAILLYTTIKSRSNVSALHSLKEIRIFKKDVNLVKVTILKCLMIIFSNLPVLIVYFFYKETDFLSALFISFFYICNALNFYILWIFNALFRKEFFFLFDKNQNRVF